MSQPLRRYDRASLPPSERILLGELLEAHRRPPSPAGERAEITSAIARTHIPMLIVRKILRRWQERGWAIDEEGSLTMAGIQAAEAEERAQQAWS